MSDIFSFEFIKVCIKAFNEKFGTKISEEYAAMFFVIVVALLIILFKFIVIPYFRNSKWRKNQLDEILKGYGHYTSWWQRWLYIDTWLQEKAPNDLDDPFEAQFQDFRTNKNAISFFVKNVLRKNNEHSPYYCILGGSGMGKSTFVANLIWKYINKYNEGNLPYPIKLINCGFIIQLIDYIKDINNKENTILILDALDENNEAIEHYQEFLKKLLDSIIYFRIVIITCRTQFFEKYKDELDFLSTHTHEPRSKRQILFRKYYVSPFNSDEISYYLRKKYLLKCKYRAYKKANSIVKKCNKLMARPLLLSYIDDLLNSDISSYDYSITRIYEIIIDKWLEREANNVTTTPEENIEYKKKLLDFSYEMALCLAKPSFEQSEVEAIINQYSAEKFIKKGYLKGRSLLNRNSKNDYKFAHKSFMEYLVAKQMFERNRTIELESIDCMSNDMIPHFLSAIIFENLTSISREKENTMKKISFMVSLSFGKVFSYSLESNYMHYLLDYISCKRHNYNQYRKSIKSDYKTIQVYNYINIQILGVYSDNIDKFLYSFFNYINKKNNKFSNEKIKEMGIPIIGLLINSNYNFKLIKSLIIDNLTTHHVTFEITLFLFNFNPPYFPLLDVIPELVYADNIFIQNIVFITNQKEIDFALMQKTEFVIERIHSKLFSHGIRNAKQVDNKGIYYLKNTSIYLQNGNSLYQLKSKENKDYFNLEKSWGFRFF